MQVGRYVGMYLFIHMARLFSVLNLPGIEWFEKRIVKFPAVRLILKTFSSKASWLLRGNISVDALRAYYTMNVCSLACNWSISNILHFPILGILFIIILHISAKWMAILSYKYFIHRTQKCKSYNTPISTQNYTHVNTLQQQKLQENNCSNTRCVKESFLYQELFITATI